MPIEFAIVEFLSSQSSYEWLVDYFHPKGLACPHCGAVLENARKFRVTKRSQVPDYRCGKCDKTYNGYSATVFEGRRLTAEQGVFIGRGVVIGEKAQILGNGLGVCGQRGEDTRRKRQTKSQRL